MYFCGVFGDQRGPALVTQPQDGLVVVTRSPVQCRPPRMAFLVILWAIESMEKASVACASVLGFAGGTSVLCLPGGESYVT